MRRKSVKEFRAFAVVLFVLSSASLFSETDNPWKFCGDLTWDAGMRLGAEYSLTPKFALKADAGSTLFSLEGNFALTCDVFAVRKIFGSQNGFQLGLMAGLPYNMIVFGSRSAMFSFGASLDSGYQWANGFGLYLRAGTGYPLFDDAGAWSFGNGKYFLWPDLALEMKLRM